MTDDYNNLLNSAFEMHTSGRLNDAKIIYEKLISINPNDINVKNLYAQLCFALNDYNKALIIFNEVYEKTKLDDILINIAKIYYKLNNFDKAIDILKSTKTLNNESKRLLAILYLKCGDYNESINLFISLLNSSDAQYSDYYNVSVAYKYINDNANALKYALEGFSLNQNDDSIKLHIASIYELLNIPDKAAEFIEQVNETNNDIKYRLGILYKNINKNKAADIFESLKTESPNDVNILTNLYFIYTNTYDYQKAYNNAQSLLNIVPDKYEYIIMAADALYNLFEYDKALKLYEKAIEKSDNEQYPIIQYAYLLSVLGQEDKAFKIYNKYNLTSSYDYTTLKLSQKKLTECIDNYLNLMESTHSDSFLFERAKKLFYKFNLFEKYGIDERALKKLEDDRIKQNTMEEAASEKAWKHQDITNKRLLISSKAGIGDLLMFSRYLFDLRDIASHIIIQVQNSCIDLFKYNFPFAEVISQTEHIDEKKYDYKTTFMKLIANLNVDLEKLTPPKNYLNISDILVKEKSKLPVLNNDKRKIGIYYQGDPKVLPNRSIKLSKFIPLFDLENTQIYSFQISDIDNESENLKKDLPLIDLKPYIYNYSDTAALLKNIDLLISIDTSIAHLAGALGVKTYLLLPFAAEWRWFHDTKTTPWYNSVRIFKQKKSNDWEEVIKRVKDECTL